jgi:hypothetical protein
MLSRNAFILESDIIFKSTAQGVGTFFELKGFSCVRAVENIEFAHLDYPSSDSNVVFNRAVQWKGIVHSSAALDAASLFP